MYFDHYYLVFVVPALLFSLVAQCMVKSTFSKYSKVQSSRSFTGREAAEALLRVNRISGVQIEHIGGKLTDHYDPSDKVLRLSDPVYGKRSIAAIGVAAHETGHAIQHATHYGPLVLRSTLVPAANIGSQFGPILAFIGLAASIGPLIDVGIILFTGAVLFYFVTLPVEINASRRALAVLRSNSILEHDELDGVRKVLTAAALTYVASALVAFANLLRLILLRNERRG